MVCFARNREYETREGKKKIVKCLVMSDQHFRLGECNSRCVFYKPAGKENEVGNYHNIKHCPPLLKEQVAAMPEFKEDE